MIRTGNAVGEIGTEEAADAEFEGHPAGFSLPPRYDRT